MTVVTNHPDREAFQRYLKHLLQIRNLDVQWPRNDFELLLKVMAHASWEFLPIRRQERFQFLFVRRPADDPAYPAHPDLGPLWSFAGSNNRGESLEVGMARVQREHFPDANLSEPRFCGCANWWKEGRGAGVGLVFTCTIFGQEPPDSQWFDWDQLPVPMVESHRDALARLQQDMRTGDFTAKPGWFMDYRQ